MKGTIELKTENLILRRHVAADAEVLYEKFGCDPEMSRYSGWNPYGTPEMAAGTVKHFMDCYVEHDFYGWAIESSGKMIGTVGAYEFDEETSQIEVGLSIERGSWGRGYATEALRAVLDYLTREEQIHRITAWCAHDNIGSKRAMEKAGMILTDIEKDGIEAGGKVYDKLNFKYEIA